MTKWKCKKCGYTLFGRADKPRACPKCGGKRVKAGKLFKEEEEDEGHYSFWDYNPMSWGFKDRTWGPFGKRRR